MNNDKVKRGDFQIFKFIMLIVAAVVMSVWVIKQHQETYIITYEAVYGVDASNGDTIKGLEKTRTVVAFSIEEATEKLFETESETNTECVVSGIDVITCLIKQD